MSNSPEFEKAAVDIKTLTEKPKDEEMLKLYGWFKQATIGATIGSTILYSSYFCHIGQIMANCICMRDIKTSIYLSIGDVNTERPGMFDLKGKYKWDEWSSHKGTSKEEAEKKYIELVEALMAKYPH